ncbi:hypothetical protein JNUCC83_01115 [Vagococcus sp. JNUCC 83]
MKKVTTTYLVLLNFLLMGCSTNDTNKQISQNDVSTNIPTSTNNAFKEVTLPTAGIVEYTITNISQEKTLNKEDDIKNAEYNFPGFNKFPEKYYRSLIDYKLKNTSKSILDLSSLNKTLIDKRGHQFDSSSDEFFLFDENFNGLMQPKTSTPGTFTLLSKKKPNLNSFTISLDSQYSDGKDSIVIGESALTTYKK